MVGYKIDIDDTQPLFCTFEATETIGDHNVSSCSSPHLISFPMWVCGMITFELFFPRLKEYIIRVQRGFDSKNSSWTIRKRYREFDELYVHLKAYNLVDLKLPPKKFFGNLNKEFISDRQAGLQVHDYLVINTRNVQFLHNNFTWFRRSSCRSCSVITCWQTPCMSKSFSTNWIMLEISVKVRSNMCPCFSVQRPNGRLSSRWMTLVGLCFGLRFLIQQVDLILYFSCSRLEISQTVFAYW